MLQVHSSKLCINFVYSITVLCNLENNIKLFHGFSLFVILHAKD